LGGARLCDPAPLPSTSDFRLPTSDPKPSPTKKDPLFPEEPFLQQTLPPSPVAVHQKINHNNLTWELFTLRKIKISSDPALHKHKLKIPAVRVAATT